LKRVLELKDRVEARIKELKEELEVMEAVARILDDYVRSRSIRPASELVRDLGNFLETREIKPRSGGEALGTVDIYEKGLLIRPSKPFSQDNAAFKKFLIGKVLEGLKHNDEELVREGRMRREEAFNYELRLDDGNVVELIIRNYKSEENLREILRSVRWTLERILK